MISQVEGRHPVLEALQGNRQVEKLFIAKGSRGKVIDLIYSLAKEKGIVIQQVDKNVLDDLSETHNHQGIIARLAMAVYRELQEIIDIAKQSSKPPLVVILDHIEDPHNLGAILRTADAAGVHGVIIPKRRAAGLTPVVAKVSAGAVEYVPVARVPNLAQVVDRLKDEGFWITAADVSGNMMHYDHDLTGPTALIIGNEGKGVSRLLLTKSDHIVKLPMLGQVSSLNASVAAGILFFEVVRQRLQR